MRARAHPYLGLGVKVLELVKGAELDDVEAVGREMIHLAAREGGRESGGVIGGGRGGFDVNAKTCCRCRKSGWTNVRMRVCACM